MRSMGNRVLLFLFFVGCGVLVVALGLAKEEEEKPFQLLVKGPKTAAPGDGVTFSVILEMDAEHYVYRESLKLKVEGPEGIRFEKPEFPKPEKKPDPDQKGKEIEIYRESLTIKQPAMVLGECREGAHTITFRLAYQGCAPQFCYMPEEASVKVPFQVKKKK
jgi:thiol:disulfide interchange protein